jgi:thioredoxin 1
MNTKKKDLSLPAMGLIIVTTLLLAGCSHGTPENTMEETGHMVPEAAAETQVMQEEAESTPPLVVNVDTVPAGYVMGSHQPYQASEFDAALADNKTVILDFHADWCHVCQDNAPLLKKALEGQDAVGFKANFDNENALKKRFQVHVQSTYILFKNGREVKRIVGPQGEEDFKALISS